MSFSIRREVCEHMVKTAPHESFRKPPLLPLPVLQPPWWHFLLINKCFCEDKKNHTFFNYVALRPPCKMHLYQMGKEDLKILMSQKNKNEKETLKSAQKWWDVSRLIEIFVNQKKVHFFNTLYRWNQLMPSLLYVFLFLCYLYYFPFPCDVTKVGKKGWHTYKQLKHI